MAFSVNGPEVSKVLLASSSSTWEHGHLKLVLERIKDADGSQVDTITVISKQPVKRAEGHSTGGQIWSGSLEAFIEFLSSMNKLANPVEAVTGIEVHCRRLSQERVICGCPTAHDPHCKHQ